MSLREKFKELAISFSKDGKFPLTKNNKMTVNEHVNNVVNYGNNLANKLFKNPSDELILFFSAYIHVYGKTYSNFKKPVFETTNISGLDFGILETFSNIKSEEAERFVTNFSNMVDRDSLEPMPLDKEKNIESILSILRLNFIEDYIKDSSTIMVIDFSRYTQKEDRLFLIDFNSRYIIKMKILNPKDSSYEYNDDISMYNLPKGVFNKFDFINGEIIFKNDDAVQYIVPINLICENPSEYHDFIKKLKLCEKFIFI